jgi:alpha-tubulin suppressor-like RCC1 family protein
MPHGSAVELPYGQTMARGSRLFVAIALVAGGLAVAVGPLGMAPASADTPAPAKTADSYFPLTPARLLETRPGFSTIDGDAQGEGPLGPNATRTLTVVGRGGVPSTGVAAVVLNVTAVTPTAASSFLTIYPTGQTRPNAANLNFVASQIVPNDVVATVGDLGQVSIYNQAGSVGLVADVAGWFPVGGQYTALTPARLLETRTGGAPFTTVDGAAQGEGPLGPSATRTLTVTGRGGVPSTGVGAVVLNVTAVSPTAANSFLTVYPTGQSQPNAANLNYTTGRIVPNLVIATVGDSGQISLYNQAGNVDLVADVTGWFPTGGQYNALTPARLLETRPGGPPFTTVDGVAQGEGALGADATRTLTVTGRGGVPSSGVAAVVLNVTAVNPTAANSFLTVYPTGQSRPLAANLNYTTNKIVPNLVVATVGDNGQISLYNQTGTVDLVADVEGWVPKAPATDISAGDGFACALRTNGTVACWGKNSYGNLGNGTTDAAALPVTVTRFTGLNLHTIAVAAGGVGACALRRNTIIGTHPTQVACWGSHQRFSFFNGSAWLADTSAPVVITNLADVSAITAGTDHYCALRTNGTVACWGGNDKGQLGDGTTTDSLETPVTVSGVTNAVAVSAGARHSCAVISGGTVRCWGDTSRTEPSVSNAATISVGGDHACAVLTTDGVTCWTKTTAPAAVTGLGSADAVDVGDAGNVCVHGVDGTEHCWGDNTYGQLANTDAGPSSAVPVTAVGVTGAVSLGSDAACTMVNTTGAVTCWGNDNSGQLGNGASSDAKFVRRPTSSLQHATAVATGGLHNCALRSDQTVACWGANDAGQLGLESTGLAHPAPSSPILGLGDATSIATGATHSCASRSSGAVVCWGDNTRKQLGADPATVSQRLQPTTVAGLSGVARVFAGADNTCALGTDSSVRCWGADAAATFAGGASTFTPTLVPGLSATSIAIGGDHDCALRTDATVACWGANDKGQLGDGTTSSSATPLTVIGGLTNVIAVAAGPSHSCAVKADGTVWCWGSNVAGQLGDAATSTAPQTTPVQVRGLANVVAVSAGGAKGFPSVIPDESYGCAVRNDGTAWCWGANGRGQLGNGTTSSATVPAQASGIVDATSVAPALLPWQADSVSSDAVLHTCWLRANGLVACTGDTGSDVLGNTPTASIEPAPQGVFGLGA